MSGTVLRLWVVDDLVTNGEVAERSATACGWLTRRFVSGKAALVARDAGSAVDWPLVVLLDYDLGAERGDVIAIKWRRREALGVSATLVGYSSSAACSQAIVRAGADAVVAKRVDERGRNPELERFLRACAGTIQHRSQPSS